MNAVYSINEKVLDITSLNVKPDTAISEPSHQTKEQSLSENKNKIEEKRALYSEEKSKDKKDVKQYSENLNKILDIFNYSIRFSVDEKSSRMIVKVINTETDEVIRQIPPETMLRLMSRIDNMLGIILDEKA